VSDPGWGRTPAGEPLALLAEPRPVLVRKRKHDGSVRVEWDGELVATGGARWLVVHHEAGRHHRRHATRGETEAPPAHALHWLGRDVPLTILCAHDGTGRLLGAKCDAALPAVIVAGGIDFVDLDVDLVVDAAGSTTVKDEAAYARNAELLGYDAETDAAVAAGIALGRALLAEGAAPFDGSGERLLARLGATRASGGPPAPG
jgi:uncharacterized protein